MTRHNNKSGFTLIELVIYIGIFSVVSVFLTGTFFTTLRINKKETSANEVQAQLNLIFQTVQRLVKESSLIEDVFQGAVPTYSAGALTNPCETYYCSVQLRMNNPALDPTIIRSSSATKTVYVKQGEGDEIAITNSNVIVDSFILAKNIISGSKDVLKIDASVSYNTTDSALSFTKAINSAVGRANAAIFDSDLIPNTDDSFDVGQTTSRRWRNGHFSEDVTVGGNLGVGTTTPSQKIEVLGNIKIGPPCTAPCTGNGIIFPDGSVQTSACMPSGTCPVAAGGWTIDPPVAPATFSTVRLTTTTDVVGIGTTTVASGYKLHINGQTKIVGGLNVDNLTITGSCNICGGAGGGGSGTVTSVDVGAGLTATPDPITTSGTISMPGLSACLSGEATFWNGSAWSCVTAGGGGGGGGEGWTDDGATVRLADATDKVGIGTASPGYKLDVLGGTSSQLHIGNIADNGLYAVGIAGSAYLSAGMAWNGTNWIAKDTAANVLEQTGGNFAFYSNSGLTVGGSFGPTARMTILSTGNVGIGVTTGINSKLTFASGTTAADGILFGTDTNLYRVAADSLKTDDSLGIGITPTAVLHLKAGTSAANTAPLKFTSGANLGTPEAGAVEYDGTNYFVTSGTTRYTLAKTLTGTATLDFADTPSESSSTALTITVTGAADGDVVIVTPPNGSVPTSCNCVFSAWVSAVNTVSVRFTNNNANTPIGGAGTPLNPASGIFRAVVFKY